MNLLKIEHWNRWWLILHTFSHCRLGSLFFFSTENVCFHSSKRVKGYFLLKKARESTKDFQKYISYLPEKCFSLFQLLSSSLWKSPQSISSSPQVTRFFCRAVCHPVESNMDSFVGTLEQTQNFVELWKATSNITNYKTTFRRYFVMSC